MSEDPWWYPSEDDLGWNEPLPTVIVGYSGQHKHGHVLAEDQDAEHDSDHWQQVGHGAGDRRAFAGDDLVVQRRR